MSFIIREAIRSDAEVAFTLIHELAIYDEVDDYLLITLDQFTEAAFGANPRFNILVAEENGSLVGVATYFHRFHIWFGENIIQIDDLFVKPSARGHGIGNKLLEAIGLMAKKENVHVRWNIERENFSTIAFYKRKGVEYQTKGVCLWAPENIKLTE
ncbi:GNAT family N-acetyltransferase [Kordiimonas pumila]|uniref:GNAT family N-acetyltransferase n=1 Tax=Kordiimonas pumila TaxID=2161677 RepID=A0ABV7D866_9PROT|nr:GNAT family N-acetyltransferase [Kordiimonas pumila]